MDDRLKAPYWALRIALGAVPVIAGLDKFVGMLADWEAYLSPLVSAIVPAGVFMKIVGVVEIAAGIIVLSGAVRLGAAIVGLWLAAISINLLTTGSYFDIAVRDLVMALGAFALYRMEEVREAESVRVGALAERRPA